MSKSKKHGKSNKALKLLLIIVMIVELIVIFFVTPGWARKKTENSSVAICSDSFVGMDVKVTELDADEQEKFRDDSKYELLSAPVSIECDGYDGTFLGEDVLYTVSVPEDVDDLGSLVFVYFDDDNNARYIYPDDIDTKNNTMSVYLPHFSFWGSAKLTKEEQIEAFLDSYSMKMAIDNEQNKQAASDLEPYVRAKVESMGLTKKATEDLIQSVMNYAGGCFKGTEEEPFKYGDTIETGTKASTTLIRGAIDGDRDAMQSGLEDVVNGSIMHCWNDLKFTERIDEVLGSEFAGKTAESLTGSVNGVARMAGYAMEGDLSGAMEELGGVISNTIPAAEITTKSAKFLASLGNLAFTHWKSNQVEELYQVYKNGAKGLFGNEVFAGDRESFLMFLNTSSGFTMAKGVNRFYNLDKIGETCEKYGWDFKDYSEMPQKYRDEFERRAENGLMEYFELRRSQEEAAEKIKEQERANIEDMLEPHNGALVAGNYMSFFGEQSEEDFDVTARLERLINVRKFISQYVDEDALNKLKNVPDSYTYGFLQNEWIRYASNYKKSEAIDKFCEFLSSAGLLKNGSKKEEVTDNDEWYIGTWSRDDSLSGFATKLEAVDDETIFVYQIEIKSAKEGNEMTKLRGCYLTELIRDDSGEFVLIGPGRDTDGNREFSPIKVFKPEDNPDCLKIVLAPREIRGTDRGEDNAVWYRRE